MSTPERAHIGAEHTATRRPYRSVAVALCASLLALALLALAPSAASAKQARLYAGSLGAATNPAPFPSNPYPLTSVEHVAVDEASGDLYVVDHFGHRVEKFDSEGHFLLMFGKAVNKTATETPGREAEEDVCPAPGHESDVCQHGQGSGHAPLEEPTLIAVDASTGPSRGDLYLSNGTFAPGGLVQKFNPADGLIEGWATGGELDGAAVTKPPHEVAGPFTEIAGIAVDPAGNLWVSTVTAYRGSEFVPAQVFEFNQQAEFLFGSEFLFQPGSQHEYGELAIDSEGGLYFKQRARTVNKFEPSGKEIGQIAPSQAEAERQGSSFSLSLLDLAADRPRGDLYVSFSEGPTAEQRGVVKRYGPSCHPLIVETETQPGCEPEETFGAGLLSKEPAGLALDSASPADPLYVADREHVAVFTLQTVPDVTTIPPAEVGAGSATLTGTVNPSGVELNEGAKGCRFEWAEQGHPYEHEAQCEQTAAQIGNGSSAVKVSARIGGLQAGKSYHYRLLASNANDENATVHQPEAGADLAFGPPLLESASALQVSATTAELQAEVNPNGLDAHVRIEYVGQAQFEALGFSEPLSTEAVDLGNASSAQTASFELSGLSPGATYHYRALAENVLGEGPEAVIGEGLAFTTQRPAPFALPDHRGWELVSPPDKHGARMLPLDVEMGATVQAAASGEAIAYGATAPTEAGPAGNNGQTQVLSARGPAGWSSIDLNAPHRSPGGTPIGLRFAGAPEYALFTIDLSRSILLPVGAFEPALSPLATEQTAYLRTDFPPAEPGAFCTASCYQPLVTAANDTASPFVPFGEEGTCPEEGFGHCGPAFAGATPDLGQILLASAFPLTASSEGRGGLYEWSAGALAQVSILPSGSAAPPATGPYPGSSHSESDSAEAGVDRGAISADGSRIVWSTSSAGNEKLYLRDTEAGHEQTLQFDAKQAGCGSACQAGGGVFRLADPQGTRYLFTDERRLTPGSGAEADKPDLYECKVTESESGKLECALTDLTPKAAEPADVLGAPLGASEDASYAYLVAAGVLATNQNSQGAKAQAGRPNLYLLHEGAFTYVATLDGADFKNWSNAFSGQPARVSPDGRWLAFMSQRSLTGYDNRDAASGKADAEVYLYHAGAGEEGTLLCASCNPTGARPHGVEYRAIDTANTKLAGQHRAWPETQWVAANLPGRDAFEFLHQPRALSDGGRLFFDSADALLPADSNGTEDVYQYESPAGGEEDPAGDACAESSPTFSPASGGCVGLISSGTSGEESAFLDASRSGEDVFFLTSSRLSKRDLDTALDVYDARVGGGEAEPARPVECEGDGCQQPASPPNDATPGSLTFHGAGNVHEAMPKPSCAKGRVRRHGKCVAKKPKHHVRRAHKRASSNRGGHR